MKARRQTSEAEQSQQPKQLKNPRNALGNEWGNFTLDGRWDQTAERLPHKRKVYDTVHAMVRSRRKRPDLLPKDLAQVIEATGMEQAFPNWQQWAQCDNWLLAHAMTGAERCVKTAAHETVPDPLGEIPPITEEIRSIIEACAPQEMPVA